MSDYFQVRQPRVRWFCTGLVYWTTRRYRWNSRFHKKHERYTAGRRTESVRQWRWRQFVSVVGKYWTEINHVANGVDGHFAENTEAYSSQSRRDGQEPVTLCILIFFSVWLRTRRASKSGLLADHVCRLSIGKELLIYGSRFCWEWWSPFLPDR